MRSALICGCVLMLAAGLLGCGSGGSDTTTTTSGGAGLTVPGGTTSTGGSSTSAPGTTSTVPANASFTARADATCARYQEQRRGILGQLSGQFRQSGASGDIAQRAAGVYRQAVASGRRELAELGGLQVPASKAASFHAYLASAATTLDAVDKLAAALGSPGSGALRSVGPEIRTEARKSYKLAQSLGLRVCGRLR